MTSTTAMLWCKISLSGVLHFDGPDSPSFLQGQLTNNVARLDNAHSQYSGYCTPKGRLLAVMLLWQRDNAYYMMLPRELCAATHKRLSMYILRAKVKAADVSNAFSLYGLSGPGAGAALAALGLDTPHAANAVVHQAGISVIKLPLDRYLVAAQLPEAARIETVLRTVAPAAPETLWTALDIEAGIPSVVTATQEQFVPQAVNFDLFGAVSFDKGCYPGQEIVARTHYLGKVKQRMVRARLQSLEAPVAGDKLYSTAYGDQASGMVVSAVCTQPGYYDLLAVVQSTSIEAADVHWKSADAPALQLAPLPYLII